MRSHVSPQRAVALTLVLLAATAGILALSVGSALAARGHVFGGAFGEPCTAEPCGAGQLKEPSAVAVNEATGEVYVLDQGDNRVERFSSTGVYEMQFDGSGTPAKAFLFGSEALTSGIAVDNSCQLKGLSGSACSAADPSNGDVYVTDRENGVVDKFNPEGGYVGQLLQSGTTPYSSKEGRSELGLMGVGVESNGTVWIYQGQVPGEVNIGGRAESFTDAESNAYIGAVELKTNGSEAAGFDAPGFAVDAEGNIYARREYVGSNNLAAYRVDKLDGSGEALLQHVDNEESSAVAVDPAGGEAFIDQVGSVATFSKSGLSEGGFGAGYLIGGRGLVVSHALGTVYVVDAATGMVVVFSPEPPSKPTVGRESVSQVSGDSATLQAEVNPRGAEAEYHFEYGPCASLATCASSPYVGSAPSSDVSIGAGFEVKSVGVHLQGLTAGTDYHFRAVVTNKFGTSETEQTFTSQVAGGFALPDGRRWEMVSPPHKGGALFGATGEGYLAQAAGNGDAFTDVANAPTEVDPAGSSLKVSVLFGRGQSGWSSKVITPPHTTHTNPPLAGEEYRFFSNDLADGVVQPLGTFPLLSPEASEATAYIHRDFQKESPGELCSVDCYRPLVDSANVPAGTSFGEEPQGRCEKFFCGPYFVGGTPDLSHVVLRSPVALTSVAAEATSEQLYEWGAGKLSLVSVLPEGEHNELGGQMPLSSGRALGRPNGSRHAISDDGSRIVWLGKAGKSTTPHLYLRDVTGKTTVRLDVFQGGASGPGTSEPQYMTASSDGSRVFFLDSERLTEDSTAGSEPDLYEYDLNAPLGKRLVDLTVDVGGHADVSSVLGASEDGSYVYFVAVGVLAPGATESQHNLYVSHEGRTSWIASLSADDAPDWSSELRHMPTRVSPNGHWLAFMSDESLTGAPMSDAVSGHPDEQVYLYDAGSARLVCASCDPTGGRPVGVEAASRSLSMVGGVGFGGDIWVASSIPTWNEFAPELVGYQSRYLSNSGRLFFNSSDALVPQDVNGTQDVYEYEPSGVGGCSEALPAFSERSDGCVGPISSGASNEESVFLDASESGEDVFFLTSGKLVSEDFDDSLDIYDARECSAQLQCFAVPSATPPPCGTADSCKAAPSPQPLAFGAPSSATFSGAGNVAGSVPVAVVKARSLTTAQKLARALRSCHGQKKHKVRALCEKRARRKYGGKSVGRARKTNDNLSGSTGR